MSLECFLTILDEDVSEVLFRFPSFLNREALRNNVSLDRFDSKYEKTRSSEVKIVETCNGLRKQESPEMIKAVSVSMTASWPPHGH